MCLKSTMWYLEKLDVDFLRPIHTKTQEKLVKSLPLLSKGNHWKNLYFIFSFYLCLDRSFNANVNITFVRTRKSTYLEIYFAVWVTSSIKIYLHRVAFRYNLKWKHCWCAYNESMYNTTYPGIATFNAELKTDCQGYTTTFSYSHRQA